VTGLHEDDVSIGDVYRIGGALVEVTQPRVPCFKLAHKIGEPTFVKQFMQAQLTGFYLRVVQEGEVGAGDHIERVAIGPQQMSVRRIFRLLYVDHSDLREIERARDLEALSPGWRESFAELVEKALS
jgi:MOSC domain-containing protein YiiM